jgi:poly [ADP-ribose] polymerase
LEISSKLDARVQELIKVIFDFRMMNSHMREIGYDEKRLPLGKLGEKVIT